MTPHETVAKAEARAKREALEKAFAAQCRAAGLHPAEQVKLPGLNYRWDFGFLEPEPPVLIEIQGGIWQRGGHNTGTGLTRDYKKNNAAVLAGFRTLYFTAADIKDGSALRTVQAFLLINEKAPGERGQVCA